VAVAPQMMLEASNVAPQLDLEPRQSRPVDPATSRWDILEGDAFKQLNKVSNGSCKLVVTSPPYNIGKEYERDERLTLAEYLRWISKIIRKLCKKVSEDGHICWQSGNFIENGEVFPLDVFYYQIFKKLGFKLRNRIIWHFNFGLNATARFSGRYETLLWFTKSDNYTFNLDPVRVRQLYPGKRHSSKKGVLAGLPSGNPKGKNPSDFWEFNPKDSFEAHPIWELPNVKANHPEKTAHPCQFPSELVARCILALTREEDLVLDPFIGSGTTAIAALQHNRRVIGIDRDSRYVRLAEHRLELLMSGELRMRAPGMPVRSPRVGEGVATVPPEWLSANLAGADCGSDREEGEAQEG
jgi:adenine-specific DNA-methyltransferase